MTSYHAAPGTYVHADGTDCPHGLDVTAPDPGGLELTAEFMPLPAARLSCRDGRELAGYRLTAPAREDP